MLLVFKNKLTNLLNIVFFSINDRRNKITADLHILSGFQAKPSQGMAMIRAAIT